MGTRLTRNHVETTADDGGMRPAATRVSTAAAAAVVAPPPNIHSQSTHNLARATGELEPAADTLLTGAPQSVVSCQASCGVKSASRSPGPEQPSRGAVTAYRDDSSTCTSTRHREATFVTTSRSSGRRSIPAHICRWPSQESPTTPTGRSAPSDQEVGQAHWVSCHPIPNNPKVERRQSSSSSSPLGPNDDAGRDGYAWPREASTAAQSGGHMTCAAASPSAALPFRASPLPPGHAASPPPEDEEAGGEAQEDSSGNNRTSHQGGNVGVGTTGIRMVGDTKRGVSFYDRPQIPDGSGGTRKPALLPTCHFTNHCHPPRRRFGQPPESSFRVRVESSGVSVREKARGRQGCVRQVGCPNRKGRGVWGGAGIDTGTTSRPERRGVCPNERSDGVCGVGGTAAGRASTPEGVCPPQIGFVDAALVPPISPSPQDATAVTLLAGATARRDIAGRTFRNPLLEALDVRNPLLGAVTSFRGLDGWW